jgi:hypothetical protein
VTSTERHFVPKQSAVYLEALAANASSKRIRISRLVMEGPENFHCGHMQTIGPAGGVILLKTLQVPACQVGISLVAW